MKKGTEKQIILIAVGIIVLVIAIVGVSYAAFSYSKTGTKVNSLTTGQISMSYNETSNVINLTNALPTTDTTGKALSGTNQYFDFTVATTVQGVTTINYVITASKESGSTLPDTAVKVYLTNRTSGSDVEELEPTKVSELTTTTSSHTTSTGAPAGQYILKSSTANSTTSNTYRLRMWVADDYTSLSTSQSYKLRVNVYGKAAAA